MASPKEISAYPQASLLAEGEDLSLFKAVDPKSGKKVLLWTWKGPIERAPLHEHASPPHAAFAPILEKGSEGGVSFVVQALPEGKPLAELLSSGPLSAKEALTLVSRAALALAALHWEGKVHGNLSPWSLFVSGKGDVEILGLGLGGLSGPTAYLSPEKTRGEKLTPATDVFALGVLLYECLAGFPPFAGRDRAEQIRAIVYAPPPRLGVARPGLSPRIKSFLHRCLEKDPDRRWADAAAFLEGLLSLLLADAPALEPSSRRRSRRLWLLAAAGVLAALASGGIWTATRPPEETVLIQDAGPYTGWERVAVMEPIYTGESAEHPYLVQGIVEEIVSALSTNTTLDVISTLSTRVYKQSEKSAVQIARELGADGLIESTLIEEGDGLKLHIRLAEGRTGRYLWDHAVSLSGENVMELQNLVEGVLYSELRPLWVRTQEHLQRAATVEAYALFLEGRRLYHQYGAEENRRAIQKLEEALEKDPSFAPAWAALARAYANVVNVEESLDPSWLDKAEAAAEGAIEIAPRLPDGYCAKGVIAYFRFVYFGRDDWSEAVTELDKALALSPDFPDALLAKAFLLLSKSMQADDVSFAKDALRLFERALTLQPNVPNAEANYAFTLCRAGQGEAARERLEQVLQVHPEAERLHITLADVLLLQGDAEKAAEVTAKALRRGILTSPVHRFRLAAFYAAAGRPKRAREILSRLRTTPTYYEDFFIGSAWAGIGEERKALDSLRAWRRKMGDRKEQQGFFRWWLREDPNFGALRSKGALGPFLSDGPFPAGRRRARLVH